MRFEVLVSGPASARVLEALAELDIAVVTERTPGAIAHLVVTPRGEGVPDAPADGLPWLWLPEHNPPGPLLHAAALEGAYDTVGIEGTAAMARLEERLEELAVPDPELPPLDDVVAGSTASRQVLLQLVRAARTSMPVLIVGETGTGKERAAHLVHTWSARREHRFVPINCAAIPNELMEGELFGYVKGAFSGAIHGYDGALMAGEGGTIFLDEIDDTPLSIQAKLLRVLEDRVVTRLGEHEPRHVDFRIVAATNRDLRHLIAEGLFGADLYERLAIVSVRLPPLRERLEDLPALCDHFIRRFQAEEPAATGAARVTRIAPAALESLSSYPWPGNIRELRNVIFGALVYKRSGQTLLLSDLPRRIVRGTPLTAAERPAREALGAVIDPPTVERAIEAGRFSLRAEVENLERAALTVALARAEGNAARAAALLGEVGRGHAADPGGTVRAMIRRLGLARTRR